MLPISFCQLPFLSSIAAAASAISILIRRCAAGAGSDDTAEESLRTARRCIV